MFQRTPFNLQSDLQKEVNNYMMQHEPPMEHQLYRVLNSLSSELLNTSTNQSNIRFLTSSDSKKERFIIILPCKNISSNLQDMIDQVMAKFNYKRLNIIYVNELQELFINYKI